MNRFGWLLAALFILVIGGFALLVRPATGPNAAEPVSEVMAGVLPVPVLGVARTALNDTWGQSRADGARAHDAIDIAAPAGTAVIAVTDGVVEKLFESGDGGTTLYLRSADGTRIYYYAHLARYAAGIAEGAKVRSGQSVGAVGATGNADPSAPHLHFAVMEMAPGDRWYQGRAINPFPLLTRRRGART